MVVGSCHFGRTFELVIRMLASEWSTADHDLSIGQLGRQILYTRVSYRVQGARCRVACRSVYVFFFSDTR